MLNTYIKPGFKILFKVIICIFLSVMTFFSFIFIFSQTATEKIGYKLYILDAEKSEYVYAYDHYFSDGEDEYLAELDLEYQKVDIRSDFDGPPYYVTMTVSQIFVLAAFIAMIYGGMYQTGGNHRNKVLFGRMKPDKWYGFKVGTITGGILLVIYLLLILSKLGIIADEFLGVYVLSNYHLYFIVKLIIGSATLTSQLSIISLILCGILVFIVPFACQLFYTLGYKQINILEKIVYKKK